MESRGSELNLLAASAGVLRLRAQDPGPMLSFMCAWSENILANPSRQEFAPGLTRRAEIVLGADLGRGLNSPMFLTDLGMRRFLEPRHFLELHAERWPQAFASPADALTGYEASFQDGAGDPTPALDPDWERVMDGCVLLWGDYDAAAQVAGVRNELGCIARPSLAIHMATALAHVAPAAALHLLRIAAERSETLHGVFTSRLRAAVVQIKRAGDARGGCASLDDLAIWVDDVLPGDARMGDRAFMNGMIENLRAYAHIRAREFAEAARCSSKALESTEATTTVIALPQALRYRTQVVGNAAKLAWVRGNHDHALALWRANATSGDDFSRSETYASLACGLYLTGAHMESSDYALNASRLFASSASPVRLGEMRRIHVAALRGAGRAQEAADVHASSKTDPLGFALLRDPSA